MHRVLSAVISIIFLAACTEVPAEPEAALMEVTAPPLAAVVFDDPASLPRTWRLDYFHTGNASEERFSFARLVIEPLPWPGNPARPIDDLGLGKYLFELYDAATGDKLYTRGFASIYGEWETTAEAEERHRTFHESLRFPLPAAVDDTARRLRAVIHKRDAANAFVEVWEIELDTADMFVDPSLPPRQELYAIERNGDPAHKVDLLLLGDGYTVAERDKFVADARRLSEELFKHSPFRERRQDFNVWGICPPAAESGVSRPSSGLHRRSPVGSTYDAFGSERYVLTFENRAFRDVASWAPYDVVEILVNQETYGGGGIYGLYGTVAATNEEAAYVFVHEFGHHLAALADEYYTAPVAYQATAIEVEPWEPNVTALFDPAVLKWRDLITDETPLPTPWPKHGFEEHVRGIQARRRAIRAEGRPEAEMSALFAEAREVETRLFASAEHGDRVGAFEGANYAATGYFRPQIDCIMFSRNAVPFCAVCRRAIERVIDLYTDSV